MFSIWKNTVLMCVLTICCALPISAQRSSAAKGVNATAAPVPTPLLNGKRAFISYELGDVSAFPSKYSGGPERAYNEFFADMKDWGRYELVMDPNDADVVFAIRFVDAPDLAYPQMRVGVSDAKTHVALWGFVEEVNPALRKKHRDNAFSDTIELLVADIHDLITPGAPQTPVKPAGKTRLSDEAR
jgi:hypothetical protein